MNPLFTPLPFKEIEFKHEYHRRVMFFDLKDLKVGFRINHNKRFPDINTSDLFPKTQGICGCGCNVLLTGRQRRWAHDDCNNFAYHVRAILAGYVDIISFYIGKYYGYKCCKCDSTYDLKLDHIIPVKHGGGGGWLSNYQFLCHQCHVHKTNEDFGWKGRSKQQLEITPP